MNILVINPNSSAQMTEDIKQTSAKSISSETNMVTCCVEKAPKSIEGFYDGAVAAYHMVETAIENKADGYIVACFDDTGVDALREKLQGPVVGIGEAAMHTASLLGTRFSIITSLERSVPIIEDNTKKYGLAEKCRGVHAFNLPVLCFEKNSPEFDYKLILNKAKEVLAKDRSEVIILGCGGMSHLKDQLQADLGVPVIEGISVAIKLIEGLLSLGLSTSKTGAYAQPRSK